MRSCVLLLILGCLLGVHTVQAYYSPEQGRWLSRDPIEENGGVNQYEFAYNAPSNYFDKDGRIVGTVVIIGSAVILWLGSYDIANAPAPNDPVYPSQGIPNMICDGVLGTGISSALVFTGKIVIKCCGRSVGSVIVAFGRSSRKGRNGANTALSELLAQNVKNGVTPPTTIGAWDCKTGEFVAANGGRVAKLTADNIDDVLAKAMAEIGELGKSTSTSGNVLGNCAEQKAANMLMKGGANIQDVYFTKAIRSRTGQVIDSCGNCLALFENLSPMSWPSFGLGLPFPAHLLLPCDGRMNNSCPPFNNSGSALITW